MDAAKFERLISHLIDNYDAGGKSIVPHIDNASCRSRRSTHWVSRTEVEEGKMARRGGEQRRVGGWGQAKCANWLTGSAKNTDQEVAAERCVRSLRALGVVAPNDAGVIGLRQLATANLPNGAKNGRGAAQRYRDVVMEVSSPERYAVEETLRRYGYSSDRTPPYEKRFSGAELWWSAIKNCYRFPPSVERREKGTSAIILGRMDRTSEREAAGYISHTNDFAVAVADRNYDFLSMVDADLVAALKKRDASEDAA